MKIFASTILLILVTVCGYSQITVQPESLPDIGDILLYRQFTGFDDTSAYRASGENQLWVLDSFNLTGNVEESYLDINGTSIGDTFPEANMLVSLLIFEAAAIRTDSSIDIIGVLPGDFSGFGVETNPVFSEPFAIRKTPFQYGDMIEDELSFQIQFPSSLIPGLDTIEIPFASLDSIRVTITISKSEEATAWGDLEFDDQIFDVLQIKQMEATNTLFEAGLSTLLGFVWVDATQFIGDIASTFNQQSTTYKFVTADSKVSIIEFRETLIQDTILNVTGRIGEEVISGLSDPISRGLNFSVYPNPSDEYIIIRSKNNQMTSTEVLIVNTDGKICRHIPNYLPGNKISLRNLPSGLYYVGVYPGNQLSFKLISVWH
jgi:hypothetical protein